VAGRGTVAPHGATFADGVRANEVCDAIVLSAREGRRVSLA
jgi:predicted dehydrogenase